MAWWSLESPFNGTADLHQGAGSGELRAHGGHAFLAPELAPDEPFRPVFPSFTWFLGGTKKPHRTIQRSIRRN
jgi:hypothetical protein